VNPSFASKFHSRPRLLPLASGVLLALATLAQAPRPAAAQVPATDGTPGCTRWEVQYAIAGTLWITETQMGAGNGTFPVGPGTLVLRLDTQAARGMLLRFDLQEHFAIRPNAVLWNATVVTDTAARVVADGAGAAASGRWFGDGILQWDAPLHGYRSDGSLTCDGSLCGKFGAPPQGRSELHQASSAVRWQPFRFDREGQTFQMDFALVSSSEAPRQRSYLALAGRRTGRTCIQADAPHTGVAAMQVEHLER
jgi:hypothetical protein